MSTATVEMWVKVSPRNNHETMISCHHITRHRNFVLERPDDLRMFWRDSTETTSVDFADGQWHHFAMANDVEESDVYWYVDGQETTDGFGGDDMEDVVTLVLGQRQGGLAGNPDAFVHEGAFTGEIDELRVWSVKRTQAEIQETMDKEVAGNTPNLMHRWSFDEGSGDSCANAVPGGPSLMLMQKEAGSTPVTFSDGVELVPLEGEDDSDDSGSPDFLGSSGFYVIVALVAAAVIAGGCYARRQAQAYESSPFSSQRAMLNGQAYASGVAHASGESAFRSGRSEKGGSGRQAPPTGPPPSYTSVGQVSQVSGFTRDDASGKPGKGSKGSKSSRGSNSGKHHVGRSHKSRSKGRSSRSRSRERDNVSGGAKHARKSSTGSGGRLSGGVKVSRRGSNGSSAKKSKKKTKKSTGDRDRRLSGGSRGSAGGASSNGGGEVTRMTAFTLSPVVEKGELDLQSPEAQGEAAEKKAGRVAAAKGSAAPRVTAASLPSDLAFEEVDSGNYASGVSGKTVASAGAFTLNPKRTSQLKLEAPNEGGNARKSGVSGGGQSAGAFTLNPKHTSQLELQSPEEQQKN